MKHSFARAEYQIRRPLLRDPALLEGLPEDLQDFTAGLLATIADASVLGDDAAIARLRALAKTFGSKSADPYQAERWAALQVVKMHRGEAPMLVHALAGVAPEFGELDVKAVEHAVAKAPGDHRLAAVLSVACDAFNDAPKSEGQAARAEAVTTAMKRYQRAMGEPSRKTRHAR